MKTKQVISFKNTPTRPPIGITAVSWLLLDRFHQPGWVWGVVGTVVVILWVAFIVSLFTETPVDIFEKKG